MLAFNGSFGPVLLLLLLAGLAALLMCRRRGSSHQNPKDATVFMAPVFLIKPYLQLGDAQRLPVMEAVHVLFHSKHNNHRWHVQVRVAGEDSWRAPVEVSGETVDIASLSEHLRFNARLDNLPAGQAFDYRVLADSAVAFSASGKARHAAHQPFTFVAAGDLGKAITGEMQPIAQRIAELNPGFLALAGDIVYERGRVSEALDDVFAVYNADQSAPDVGGPVLRSTIMLPAPGNHDVALPNPQSVRDFKKFKDLLAYFIFWSAPLNGPQKLDGANTPRLEEIDEKARGRFLKASAGRYPAMGCYSLDWGNLHLTVLDSNAYMNWADAELVNWVENDLATARYATWRVVMFHHPSFSSDGKHSDEQRMRLLAPLFQRWAVDLVLTGHNHCYERSKPLHFKPDDPKAILPLNTEDCKVKGTLEVDDKYDGKNHTRPDGTIYLVDGAAGAKFYPHSKPEQPQPFTQFYDQSEHSFTYFTVNGRRMTAHQITATGKVIDSFIIDKDEVKNDLRRP